MDRSKRSCYLGAVVVAAAAKRAATVAAQQAANRAWNAVDHPEFAGVDFARDIWPTLRGIPVRQLAKATGLSVIYCSRIRSGEQVPHPRHWGALAVILNNAP